MANAMYAPSTCVDCGGSGCGLVVAPKERLCAHCARLKKVLFDPEKCKWCMDGFFDISPNADGGILKKFIKDGEKGARVVEGCPTFVQYVGRLDDGSIFDTTRDIVDGKHVGGTDDPFEFQLGREKVIKGWDIGIATMHKGEIARFIIKPEYAYGSQGFPPKVEPHATLDFEIELVSFKESLPRFPTQAELAESRKKREEEARKMNEENPPPTIDEKIASSTVEKEKGNALVAQQKYEEARKQYDSAFVYIFVGKEEWDCVLKDEDKEKINNAKLPLHLNRALCKLKMGKADDALWDCDKALEIDPQNIKGLFRRGLVFTEKLRNDLEKESKGVYWDVDRAYGYHQEALNNLTSANEKLEQNKDPQIEKALVTLQRLYVTLKKYAANYKEQQRTLYKEKIIGKMEKQNKKIQQLERKKALEDEFADMPPLE